MIFGANLCSARERRHLIQQSLGRSAGLSKAGLSLIERGVRETSVQTLLALARALEVPPELLLEGIAWRKPERPPCEGSRARRPGRSLDDAIRRLWNEDKTAREIAEAVGTSPGTVSATVHRLRERGEPLRYRRRPTRAVPDLDSASNEEIAARIGANVALRREEAGLTLRQLSEAAETHFTHLPRVERGKSGVPQLALILKLAGSLNVRYRLITAGVVWDSTSGSFRVQGRYPRATNGARPPGAERPARALPSRPLPTGAQRPGVDEPGRSCRFRARQPQLQELHGGQTCERSGDRLRRAVRRGGELAYPPARGAGIPAGRGSDQSPNATDCLCGSGSKGAQNGR
jgi:transcriptional regulator with XRE-family HTH domain